MSSTGAGVNFKKIVVTISFILICSLFQYDYSCGTFSPDGRIFQIEYAQKAVENSGFVSFHCMVHLIHFIIDYYFIFRTAIGLKCVDGIVVVVEKVM